jgi:hypothetical protein
MGRGRWLADQRSSLDFRMQPGSAARTSMAANIENQIGPDFA